jgi:hypothetical protein
VPCRRAQHRAVSRWNPQRPYAGLAGRVARARDEMVRPAWRHAERGRNAHARLGWRSGDGTRTGPTPPMASNTVNGPKVAKFLVG